MMQTNNDAAMRRAMGKVIKIAERERIIDLRHEEPPAGDAPYWSRAFTPIANDPDRDINHDWAHFVLRMIGVGMLVIFAAILIGLASLTLSFGKDMPKGLFLGGPPPIGAYPYGQAHSGPLHEWFDRLASKKGLCCSFADGLAVEPDDVGFANVAGADGKPDVRYRVRIDGRWIVVPPEAVVTVPNKFGRAVVWPYVDGAGVTQIRCFIAGSGT